MAYAVGLLVTDGNLSRDERHITFRSSEIDLLNTFKSCLNLKNKIGSTKNQRGLRIQFSNVQFYRWLIKIGLFPAKTYSIGAIQIPNNFFKDFLRGHLDGDGNISVYIDRYNIYRGRRYINQRIFTRFISASEKHIDWLHGKISELSGVKGARILEKRRNGYASIHEIKFAKKESVKLLKWIYYKNNLPCLKRKRDVAEKTIRVISKEKRKKYTTIKNS